MPAVGDIHHAVWNRITERDDTVDVQCEQWIEAISATADGEDPGVDQRLLRAHLAHCASCTQFAAAIEGSRRRRLVQPAPVMADLSRQVSKTNAVLDRAASWSIVRILLLVIAVLLIVLSVPALVLGEGDAGAHDARHLGAFSIAYAVALLVVVLRPARARAMLPVAAVLAGALLVTAVVDLFTGSVPLVNEALHLPELISVVLVWLLAVPARRRPVVLRVTPSTGLRVAPEHSDRDTG